MAKTKSNPLPPRLGKPSFQFRNPDKVLTEEQFELVTITAEDLRHLIWLVEEEMVEDAAEIRILSTMLRRLLREGDIFKAMKLLNWSQPIKVRGRQLIFPTLDPRVIVSCGNYRWGHDTLPATAMTFIGASDDEKWKWEEDVEFTLSAYLDSLAFAITGIRVKRRDVISYVANKKAAHVSGSQTPQHKALDHAWFSLGITRVNAEDEAERLNLV